MNEKTNELNEAPASATAKVRSPRGFSYLFTLRATTGTQLLTMLENFEKNVIDKSWTPETNGLVPKAAGTTAANHMAATVPVTQPCPIHAGATMYEKENAKGKWFSHKTAEGQYCNGRSKDYSAAGAF